MKRLLLLCCSVALLSGCGTFRGYEWGGYDSHLYRYYDNPRTAENFRTSLAAHVQRLEEKGKIPPPGIYAELGTLYLEAGDTQQAIFYYDKEQEVWPESRHLMSSLISNLSKQQREE